MTAIHDHPLLALPKFGTGPGLHRVRSLMTAVGIAADIGESCIVITGSNGKGSTARIASELLCFDGADVGLFTSPHLYRYNERIQVNGTEIADADLIAAMDEVRHAVARYQALNTDSVGAFEAQFVTALLYFQQRQVRWRVLEAGIGGRYDPSRMVQSALTGLVSLDFEHTDLLGKSLAEIAFDKLDATRRGGMAILGETALPLERQIRTYADLTGLKPEFLRPANWKYWGLENGRQRFDIHDPDIVLANLSSSLIGRHQINNHAVAIRLCCETLKRSGLWPQAGLAAKWRAAIEKVSWPGRLEKIHDDPATYIDVGHTPEGVRAALSGYLSLTAGRASILVTGGSKNKDVRRMLEILARAFDRILCTAAHHNGLGADEVLAIVKDIHPSASADACPNITGAAEIALREAAETGRAVYAAGGLFLAAEFAEACRGGAPEKLRFF